MALKILRRAFVTGSRAVLLLWWSAGGGFIGWLLQFWPAMQSPVAIGIGIAIGFVVALLVAHHNQDLEIERLKAKLDDREAWLEICHRLGEFGIAGRDLMPRASTSMGSWEEIYRWTADVEAYLENKLGKGHRFLFSSGAGNEPKVPDDYITKPNARDQWVHIQARLITLKELTRMASSRADRIMP